MNAGRFMAVTLASAVALAGCGGGDESPAPAEALTKEEFIAQADAICAASNGKFDADLEDLKAGGEPSQEELMAFYGEEIVSLSKDEATQIDALAAPEGDEEEVDAIVTALNAAVAEVESNPDVITGGEDPFQEYGTLAADYGLAECR